MTELEYCAASCLGLARGAYAAWGDVVVQAHVLNDHELLAEAQRAALKMQLVISRLYGHVKPEDQPFDPPRSKR